MSVLNQLVDALLDGSIRVVDLTQPLGPDTPVIGLPDIFGPSTDVEEWPVPIHQCCLVAMGVHLLDNLDLSGLSATCATHSRWEFLLTVAPLPIEGGTGSPVNPVAVF